MTSNQKIAIELIKEHGEYVAFCKEKNAYVYKIKHRFFKINSDGVSHY